MCTQLGEMIRDTLMSWLHVDCPSSKHRCAFSVKPKYLQIEFLMPVWGTEAKETVHISPTSYNTYYISLHQPGSLWVVKLLNNLKLSDNIWLMDWSWCFVSQQWLDADKKNRTTCLFREASDASSSKFYNGTWFIRRRHTCAARLHCKFLM